METEVWPEMTAACAERGIPLVLANARLNEKSLAAAERLAWLARPAYSALAAVWAQTEADSHRLVSLGAKVAGVYGNLKFDATPDMRQLAAAAELRAAAAQADRGPRKLARRRGAAAARSAQALRRAWRRCRPSRRPIRSIAQPRARRAVDDRAAPPAALRRSGGAGRVRMASRWRAAAPPAHRPSPRSGSAIRWARWRSTTASPMSRCLAAASSRWAART